MREIPIFIASSIREFEREREQISVFLDILNDIHKRDGVELVWKRPETMSEAYYFGGTQRQYDQEILKSRFFILIVGKKLGEHTKDEFRLALEQFKKTGAPILLFYFLDVFPDMEVQTFRDELRKLDAQYVNTYQNFDQILNKLHIELIRHGAFVTDAEPSSDEETAQKGQDAARKLIFDQWDKIQTLDEKTVTPQVIAELTDAYEELRRLVQTYKVEPDTLLDYMYFLWQQHLYDTGIEVGHWLENFYRMEPPSDDTLAKLKNRLGLCYDDSKQYDRAEQYYEEALKINRRLASENPDFEAWVARTCNNLGILLSDTSRPEEAEQYLQQALEIYQRFAEANPAAYEPDLAQICNNLGILLSDTSRPEEAEQYLQQALEIYQRSAEANPAAYEPNVARTCGNLGSLLSKTNRPDEAEQYYREALEIYQRLAEANPAAYEPNLAWVCNNLAYLFIVADKMEVPVSPEQIAKAEPYLQKALEIWSRYAAANPKAYKFDVALPLYNLGVLEYKRHKPEAAEPYFEEALAIFEEYPHCADKAQKCRDALARL